ATSIREDKARDLYLKMVQQLEDNNKTRAAGWKSVLDRNYQDTSIYAEAVAYYTGDMDRIRNARRQAAEAERAQRAKRREERLRRAQERGDTEAATAIAATTEEDDEPSQPIVASGDAGAAQAYYEKGCGMLATAQNMTATKERDQLYAKAQKEFEQAVAIFEKLGMEAEMSRANQYRYACIKCRRF
ncbi:MAG: hypothetical protein ACYTF0_03480, partial [Planctomycetota bacterium]